MQLSRSICWTRSVVWHKSLGYRQCAALRRFRCNLLREHHIASYQGAVGYKTPAHFEMTGSIEFVHIHSGAVVDAVFPSADAANNIEVAIGIKLRALAR